MSSGLLGHPQHIGGHVEAHLLRVAMLETVGADLRPAARNPARKSCRSQARVAGARRIAARRQQPVVDARRTRRPAAPPGSGRGFARPPRASIEPVRSRPVAKRAAKAEKIRRERQQPRNVRRFERSAQTRPSGRATGAHRRKPECAPAADGRAAALSPCRPYRPSRHESRAWRSTGSNSKSGARSAKSTAISFVRAASGASASAQAADVCRREEADLDIVDAGRGDLLGLGADRFRLHRQIAADRAGRRGVRRSDDTAWRMVSVATAPSAPAFGSFRSMMSAPPAIAISASATPVTLASILVISSASPAWRTGRCGEIIDGRRQDSRMPRDAHGAGAASASRRRKTLLRGGHGKLRYRKLCGCDREAGLSSSRHRKHRIGCPG